MLVLTFFISDLVSISSKLIDFYPQLAENEVCLIASQTFSSSLGFAHFTLCPDKRKLKADLLSAIIA